MSKVGFVARWGMVFSVLGGFTVYSLVAMGVGNSTKAYADTISSNASLQGANSFVVVDDEDDGNGGDRQQGSDHGGSFHHKLHKICALDQGQLDALRAAFPTTVVTKTIDGQTKNFAKIDKADGVNKHTIYQTIGVDTQGPKCKIIKESQSFLLFLVPGVS
jgi:hypothetical protein